MSCTAALETEAGGAMTVGLEELTTLYRRHSRALLVFFQRRVHEAEVATDLTADTFTTALEQRE